MSSPDSLHSDSFRGYEVINPCFTDAAVALIDQCGLSERFAAGHPVEFSRFPNVKAPRYLTASLDFLVSQGVLEQGRDAWMASDSGREFFSHADIIRSSVFTYTAVLEVLENLLEWEHRADGDRAAVERSLLNTLIPPALAAMKELRFSRAVDHDVTAAFQLEQGESINVAGLVNGRSINDLALFMRVLKSAGLVEGTFPKYRATDRGRRVFRLAGYAELAVSYYEMLQKLHPLMQGILSYGIAGDVNRHSELNARASSGILDIRVAPYIVKVLSESGGSIYIDYGSGGGDMLIRAAKGEKVKRLLGIDINPKAVSTAQRIVGEAGLSDRIELMTGSITDKRCMQEAARRVSDTEGEVVASINFILHDIGPELSRDFLRLHAEVFGDAPLIITETLKMPMEVLRAHPNHQAPSFQFMHEASGQTLYTAEEFQALLEECGYEIVSKIVHSAMPGVEPGEKLPMIVTWVTRYRGAAA